MAPPTPYWTPEKIVQALRSWAKRHGRPPTSRESESQPKRAARRCPTCGQEVRVTRRRPSAQVVKTVFGSWNAGLQAAGLKTRGPGDRL